MLNAIPSELAISFKSEVSAARECGLFSIDCAAALLTSWEIGAGDFLRAAYYSSLSHGKGPSSLVGEGAMFESASAFVASLAADAASG